MADPSRLVVGISGASGVIYGVRLLQALKELPVETHLVMTRTAEITLAHETTLKVAEVNSGKFQTAVPYVDHRMAVSFGGKP